MKLLAALFSLMTLGASGGSRDIDQVSMMNTIDAAVVMPKGALALDQYARYFAFRTDGKIAVFYTAYVAEDVPKPSDYGCSEMLADFSLQDVPCPADDRPKAGERIWVSYDMMPGASDGGCSIVNVVFNPLTGRVEETACNGPI